MIISGTCGNQTVNSLDELLHILRSCREGDYGEFWIGREDFPVLVIHTNRDLAYLHYLPADGHPGFQVIAQAGLEGVVTFKQEGQGDLCMPRALVIPVEQAYQAAAEFFTNASLPSCVRWAEL